MEIKSSHMVIKNETKSSHLLRETEKPKVVGKSLKSRFKSVDLPAPEGPENTKNDFGNDSFTKGGTKKHKKVLKKPRGRYILIIERARLRIERVLGDVRVTKC